MRQSPMLRNWPANEWCRWQREHMKFKTDENLSPQLAGWLRACGHDALSVLDQQMGGRPDENVAEVILAEHRALVTLDLDFSNIQSYPPACYPGIIVLRTVRQDHATVMRLMQAVLPLIEAEGVEGKLWIVEEGRVRVR